MKVLIIIPAYNEEESIGEVLNNLNQNYPEYDYVVVNDCSKDRTESILSDKKANYINLPVNLGIGGGIQTGYKYAKRYEYDIAIQMDGDGQHDPAYIQKLIEPIINEQADSTIGSRFIDNEGFQSSFMRRLGINFLSGLIKLVTGERIYDVTSGFRAVNRKGIELFAEEYAQDYPEPEAIVTSSMSGIKIQEVPVVMKERQGGVSSINGLKTAYYMIKVSIAIVMARLCHKKRV